MSHFQVGTGLVTLPHKIEKRGQTPEKKSNVEDAANGAPLQGQYWMEGVLLKHAGEDSLVHATTEVAEKSETAVEESIVGEHAKLAYVSVPGRFDRAEVVSLEEPYIVVKADGRLHKFRLDDVMPFEEEPRDQVETNNSD